MKTKAHRAKINPLLYLLVIHAFVGSALALFTVTTIAQHVEDVLSALEERKCEVLTSYTQI